MESASKVCQNKQAQCLRHKGAGPKQTQTKLMLPDIFKLYYF